MKTLIYKVIEPIKDCYLDPHHPSITMTVYGYVYRIDRKFLWIKLKPIYDYDLDVPYIEDPYYDGQFNTNRTLRWVRSRIIKMLKLKIEEFKNENYGNISQKVGF